MSKPKSLFTSKNQAKADATTTAVRELTETETIRRESATSRLKEARLAREAADPKWVKERDSRIKDAKKKR